ncbi:hypothetical protein FRB94_014559 [Tulasnella sp. JGI-2019a]|nr:hypothetical protein FRB93_010992 [Tulasnella sp. JGI-2019a]KAG9007176.1 hypothetical protein FRB94_014559 [Tulasnella sp. JGI-2019a]
MLTPINPNFRITLNDDRTMAGGLWAKCFAFDKHTNLVLADREEFSRIKKSTSMVIQRPRGMLVGGWFGLVFPRRGRGSLNSKDDDHLSPEDGDENKGLIPGPQRGMYAI